MENCRLYSRLSPMDEANFNKMYALMERAFPPAEHGSREFHLAEFSRPEFRCLCYEPDGHPAGFINYFEFSEPRLLFIEHFAVDDRLRGNGIGSGMLKSLTEQNKSKLLALEVEPPAGALQRRRIAFYQRMGLSLLDGSYYQPPAYGNADPLPLMLMASQELGAEQFRELKRWIYRLVYRYSPSGAEQIQ